MSEMEKLKKILSGDIPKKDGIAIFGAGNTAILYEPSFTFEKIEPMYFIDNDGSKQGKKIMGAPIISYREAKEKCKNMLIMICSGVLETVKKLRQLYEDNPIDGTELTTVDEYVFKKNASKIYSIINELDPKSKETYINMLLVRMGYSEINEDILDYDLYFSVNKFRVIDKNEVFVDCGAFVGDTVESYIEKKMGTFKKVVAFEPDDNNYNALKCRRDRLIKEWALNDDKIVIEKAGIGSKTTKITVSKTKNEGGASLGTSFYSNDGCDAEDVQIFSIDDYFSNETVGFIKADIESYEWELLNGSETVIKRDKPLIAICIYHNPSDMFRIMLKIKEYYSGYKFSVRQQYYGSSDTILYAYK